MTRDLTYEKENEMFFLFLPCTARDLGLFRNCSRMFPGTKRTSEEHPCCSWPVPLHRKGSGEPGTKRTPNTPAPRPSLQAMQPGLRTVARRSSMGGGLPLGRQPNRVAADLIGAASAGPMSPLAPVTK